MITKEKAKELMPILKAFAEGKPLQGMYLKGGYSAKYEDWDDCESLDFDNYDYRIKSEPQLRPYTFDEMCEAVKKHGIMVKTKDILEVYAISSFDEENVFYGTDICESYDNFLKDNFWFDDGSPCGVMEE